jgi:hypothetical protein
MTNCDNSTLFQRIHAKALLVGRQLGTPASAAGGGSAAASPTTCSTRRALVNTRLSMAVNQLCASEIFDDFLVIACNELVSAVAGHGL